MFAALTLVSILAVAFAQTDIPKQVHIAFAGKTSTGDSDKMSFSWNTRGRTATSIVKYGTSSGVYTEQVRGSASSYWESFNHHATSNSLAANTKYFYTVGDDSAGWSEELSFVSAATSSAVRGNFSFWVFADLGEVHGEATQEYLSARLDKEDEPSFIIHGGDVGYADDAFLHRECFLNFCYEDAYDEYMNSMQPIVSKLPYMVAPGNHEAECHDPACLTDRQKRLKLSNFSAYNARFLMPSKESGGTKNMWHSFNYANIHFVALDTETDYEGAPEETRYVLPCGGFGDFLEWLEKDLIQASADRAVRPWIIAYGHHPIYSGASTNKALQTAVEELLYAYGVDLFFTGHLHSYERDLPTYRGAPEAGYDDPRATTHVMIGGPGNDEMHGTTAEEKEAEARKDRYVSPFADPSPVEAAGVSAWYPSVSGEAGPWTVVTDDHYGIGKVSVMDDDRLAFEYIQTSTGKVFDTFTLYRDHSKYINKQN